MAGEDPVHVADVDEAAYSETHSSEGDEGTSELSDEIGCRYTHIGDMHWIFARHQCS